MRQLIVIEFVTLDGVMQGLGSPDEDRDGGFAHGGWGAPYGDEVLQAAALEGMRTHQCVPVRAAHLREDGGVLARSSQTPTRWRRTSTPRRSTSPRRTLVDAQLTWANARVLRGRSGRRRCAR